MALATQATHRAGQRQPEQRSDTFKVSSLRRSVMKKAHIQSVKTVAASLLCSWLVACGSGEGGSTSIPPPAAEIPLPAAASLVGTAAIGAAVPNAVISVTDRTGTSACTNDPVNTGPTGAYQCALSTASQPPFAVLVTDPEGLINPMISIVATKPAPGSESTANVTPLTTAIAAQLNINKDPFALVKNPAALATVDLAALAVVKANVVTQIAAILRDAGISDLAAFDPVTSPFVGGSGTGADKMLDQIRITFDNGAPAISNVLNPAAAVPLAGPSTGNIQIVGAAATVGEFSLRELEFAKTELERCFAVPSSTRAPNPDTTNFRLRNVAPECEGFLAKVGPNIDINFKQSGQLAEVFFYGLLTSSEMDGAKFNLPELMRYTSRPNDRSEAVLNIKYRDKNGVPGNLVLTAKKFLGSRPEPVATQWWLVGNQRSINAFIRSAVRQREQLIPQIDLDTPSFSNAARSRFETGLEIFIQRPNNGTTVNWVNNPNNSVRYVRVKGPGLPTNGLVFGDVAQTLPQNWMGILNATGVNPNDSSAPQQRAITTSNIFLIQRTQGISGSAGFTLRPNPGVGSPTASFVSWAHPSMFGEPASATWSFDLSKVPAWSIYNFEVFCNDGITPCETFSSSILTPLMPAPYAATQQWHSFTTSSRSFVTAGAPQASSAEIAWTPNTLAERIGSVNAYSFGPAGSVNSLSTVVPKGTFSRTVDAVGGQFPALSTSDNTRGRTLQIRHTMLDGSYKDHLIQFN
jgi:hypothetical protein